MPDASGFTPWGAAISAASGLIGGISGLIQKHKGKQLLNSLVYPTEAIPTAIQENKALAENSANLGIPQEQYNNGLKNIQRQQLLSMRAGLDRHGVLGSLAGITQAGLDATGKLDAADAAARMNNQKTLIGVNNTYGNWQNKVWDNNVRQKYLRDYNYAQSLIGYGNQNEIGGLDKIASGAAQFGLTGGFGGRKRGTSTSSVYDYSGGDNNNNGGYG